MTTDAPRLTRKYALTKIGPGDYLLPSNDGKTIWRLTTYTEGPSTGIEGMPRDKKFWGVWRWTGRDLQTIDPNEWGMWDMYDGWCMTRFEAIQVALKANV